MKKLKKLGLMLLVLAIAVGSVLSVSFAAASDVKFVINGKPYVTPTGEPAPYVNKDYRTLVPVRFFADALGLQTNWDQQSMTATLSKGNDRVQITLGENRIYVNGQTVYMDTEAELKNGRTFIPARFIAESFGGKIGFVSATNTVSIDLKDSDSAKEKKPDEVAETDPYGRKIRTTNLPKNYGDFPYILEDIPNEMYEMDYVYLDFAADEFLTSVQFFEKNPEVKKSHIDQWMERVVDYYDLVLNVDYQTIDYSWADKMWPNMLQSANEDYALKNLREYVDWVKENKIQIEGQVKPVQSIIYDNGFSYYVRAEIEFTIHSFNENERVIYDGRYNSNKDRIVKGKTYRGYFDVKMGTNVGGHWMPHVAVAGLVSIFENSKINGLN